MIYDHKYVCFVKHRSNREKKSIMETFSQKTFSSE